MFVRTTGIAPAFLDGVGKSYVRIIQAIALAAAILGLLLTTPSLEARTRKKHVKKVKIVFDGSAAPAPSGELGDEIVQPRSSNRRLGDGGSVVHLRGGDSVDKLWAKSKNAAVTQDDLDNPDLIDPSVMGDGGSSDAVKPSKPTHIAADLSADESALGTFKKSPRVVKVAKLPAKKIAARKPAPKPVVGETFDPGLAEEAAKPVPVAATVQPLPEPILEFDDVKPVAKTHVQPREGRNVRPIAAPQRVAVQAPQSKIYMRNVQPVARPTKNALATRVATNDGPSDFKFNFAFENTTSMGRKYELETPGGRNFTMKNEVFIGTDHTSGWGAKLAANYLTTSNDDSKKDIREMGDPSIMVLHPSVFKTIDINVTGAARYYLPVSTDSKNKGLQHFAYDLIADLNLVESLQLHNDFIGRYFLQSFYADNDAFSLVQDMTELSRKFDWVRVGLGQRTQIESHQAVSPGTSVELYPFADLLAIANTVLEAKVYIPVIANGLVNGAPGSPAGPNGTGFSNVQFEFFGRISF